MFERGFILTNINYPVVPKGKDEIRVQISASHNKTDLKAFLQNIKEVGEELAII
jgi:glycine C-acetyltransferase